MYIHDISVMISLSPLILGVGVFNSDTNHININTSHNADAHNHTDSNYSTHTNNTNS